jgi:hypothetical protein
MIVGREEYFLPELPARCDRLLAGDYFGASGEATVGAGALTGAGFYAASVSTRAREAEWELGTLATDNIVRHSRRAEITTLHEVLWMRPRVLPLRPDDRVRCSMLSGSLR